MASNPFLSSGGDDGQINMPMLNPIVGQPQTMDALTSAVLARGTGGFQPGAMPGRVAMPTYNADYAQQYGNLMSAMMNRYPGQLQAGGSVFDAQPNAAARASAPAPAPVAPAGLLAPPAPTQNSRPDQSQTYNGKNQPYLVFGNHR